MPREDAVREKAVRQWAELQDLGHSGVSSPKMGRGFFLMDWREGKCVAGGPEGTLEELGEFLRASVPEPPQKPGGKRPKSRSG